MSLREINLAFQKEQEEKKKEEMKIEEEIETTIMKIADVLELRGKQKLEKLRDEVTEAINCIVAIVSNKRYEKGLKKLLERWQYKKEIKEKNFLWGEPHPHLCCLRFWCEEEERYNGETIRFVVIPGDDIIHCQHHTWPGARGSSFIEDFRLTPKGIKKLFQYFNVPNLERIAELRKKEVLEPNIFSEDPELEHLGYFLEQ